MHGFSDTEFALVIEDSKCVYLYASTTETPLVHSLYIGKSDA